MNMRVSIAVLACKTSRYIIRLLGRGGTDFPGRVALKLCPDLLGHLAQDVTTIIVTGTNGKTTTSRMVEQSLVDAGLSFFANKSGANLLSGVTAEFAMNASLSGKPKAPYGLIEADEAAFKAISKYVKAKVVVVTNVFRDQLDRYGEVTHTLNNLKIGISNCKEATLCINGDDSLARSIGHEVDNPVLYYGVDTAIYDSRVAELSDAPYCIQCKTEYDYDYRTYGHLGGYHCPSCGYGRPVPQISVTQVVETDTEKSQVVFGAGDKTYPATINLPGGYNIYNGCATMACGLALGLDLDVVASSLSSFACGFGRMEKFDIEGASLRMILIKNPAGCNQVLNFLTNTKEPSVFVVCLNDGAQDGKDVSWIWDVDFEKVAQMGDNLAKLYVSGARGEDMAVRFRYAGVPMEKLAIIKDYAQLVSTCIGHKEPVYLMPTYTAMLALRGTISKTFGFKNFWE